MHGHIRRCAHEKEPATEDGRGPFCRRMLFGAAGQPDGGTRDVSRHTGDRARSGGAGRPRGHQRHGRRHSGHHRNRGDRNRGHRTGQPHRHRWSSKSGQVSNRRAAGHPGAGHQGRICHAGDRCRSRNRRRSHDRSRSGHRRSGHRGSSRCTGTRRTHERGQSPVTHRAAHRQRHHRKWRSRRTRIQNQCTCTQANTGKYSDTGSPEALQRKLRLLVSSPPDTQSDDCKWNRITAV